MFDRKPRNYKVTVTDYDGSNPRDLSIRAYDAADAMISATVEAFPVGQTGRVARIEAVGDSDLPAMLDALGTVIAKATTRSEKESDDVS